MACTDPCCCCYCAGAGRGARPGQPPAPQIFLIPTADGGGDGGEDLAHGPGQGVLDELVGA